MTFQQYLRVLREAITHQRHAVIPVDDVASVLAAAEGFPDEDWGDLEEVPDEPESTGRRRA